MRDLYRGLYSDGAQLGCSYWQDRLGEELWESSEDGMKGVYRLTFNLESRGIGSTTAYLRNT